MRPLLNVHITNVDIHYHSRFAKLSQNNLAPAGLQESLSRCGMEFVNPAVDVLNMVMLELGSTFTCF